MSDLQNLTPANTYKGLLQVGDYTNGVDSTVRSVLDGEGTASALAISTTKVGIGTTSPADTLHVSSADGPLVTILEHSDGGSAELSFRDTNQTDQVKIGTADSDFRVLTANTERIRIDSNGNCGIGNDSPNTSLQVKAKSGNFDPSTTDNYDGVAILLGGNHTAGQGNIGPALAFTHVTGDPVTNKHASIASVQTGSDNNNIGLCFHVHPTSDALDAQSEAFRVTHDGKFGIGTNSPSAPLDVTSTTGGILFPRLTTAQRVASSGNNGEMVYDTDLHKFYGYANGAWTALH